MCRYDVGKWRHIQKDEVFGPILKNRSNVDLKDKWRNLNMDSGGSRRDNRGASGDRVSIRSQPSKDLRSTEIVFLSRLEKQVGMLRHGWRAPWISWELTVELHAGSQQAEAEKAAGQVSRRWWPGR